MNFRTCRNLLALTALSFSISVFGKDDVARNELLRKVDDPEIVRKATIGKPQKLIATLEISNELDAVRYKYRELHKKNHPTSSDADTEELTEDEETAIAAESKNEIDKVKKSLITNGFHGRSRVIEDFSDSPLFVIEITDIDALLDLLKKPRVKAVSDIHQLKPAGSNELGFITPVAHAGEYANLT